MVIVRLYKVERVLTVMVRKMRASNNGALLQNLWQNTSQ